MSEAFVGVDLGGTNVRAGKIRGQTVEALDTRRISPEESEEHVLDEVFASIDRVFDDDITAIGCGVPGLIDVAGGTVYSLQNIPSWREVPLKKKLEDRYGVEAFINNDANALALGELHFGQGRGNRNLILEPPLAPKLDRLRLQAASRPGGPCRPGSRRPEEVWT